MLLGQLVAISVASNLFFLAVLLSPPSKNAIHTRMAPPILWSTVLLSLTTIGISPYTTESTFLPNLLAMHALILIPLLPFGYNPTSRLSISTKRLYWYIVLAASALRARTTFVAFTSLAFADQSVSGFLTTAWHILQSHPAQSSIGWDVIWTMVSFVAWYIFSAPPSPSSGAGAEQDTEKVLCGSLLFSVGISAPLALYSRAHVDEADVAQKKD